MTGYGRVQTVVAGKSLLVEIRSLNSKGLDLNLRFPSRLRDKEPEIRSLLSALERGKVDCTITSEALADQLPVTINKPLAHRYHAELRELQREFGEENAGELLPQVLKMPEVLISDRQETDPAEWEMIREALLQAIDQTGCFREQEGKVMEADIRLRISRIGSLTIQIRQLEPERRIRILENLMKSLEQLSAEQSVTPDANRLEQEMIYYLEKIDFTEEMVRLEQHLAYFSGTMEETVSQGKKLGFVCQELGREINTLGSKAYHAGIQQLVVQMKDELEKIKEQLLNIL